MGDSPENQEEYSLDRLVELATSLLNAHRQTASPNKAELSDEALANHMQQVDQRSRQHLQAQGEDAEKVLAALYNARREPKMKELLGQLSAETLPLLDQALQGETPDSDERPDQGAVDED